MSTKEQLLDQIKRSEPRMIFRDNEIKYGDFVRTGLIAGLPYEFDYIIGYVVQIRKKRGACGSDQYFIRHPDGTLRVHENQCLFIIDSELFEDIKKFYTFDISIDYDGAPYSFISRGEEEIGFIIE